VWEAKKRPSPGKSIAATPLERWAFPVLRQQCCKPANTKLAGYYEQGNRMLIALKSAQDAFEEVFIPSGLQSFAAETPAGGSVAL